MLGISHTQMQRDQNGTDVPKDTASQAQNGTDVPPPDNREERDRKSEAEWASTTLLHDTLAYLNPRTLTPEEWAKRTIIGINPEAWPTNKLAQLSSECLQNCLAALAALVDRWEEK
jgi:hypothetical protein